MSDMIDATFTSGKEEMENTISHFENQLLKIRTGKASPSMLSGVMVSYYGAPTPIGQVANVSVQDSRTLAVQPWEKSILADIEKGIFEANLGLTPMNDGEVIRVPIPPLTEERRKAMVKKVKAEGEDAKVSLRNTRHKIMDTIKKEVKDGYPEDEGKKKEDQAQKMIVEYNKKIEDLISLKEKELLKI